MSDMKTTLSLSIGFSGEMEPAWSLDFPMEWLSSSSDVSGLSRNPSESESEKSFREIHQGQKAK